MHAAGAPPAAKPKKRVGSLKETKERKDAIASLQKRGLAKGKNGWALQDMLKHELVLQLLGCAVYCTIHYM